MSKKTSSFLHYAFYLRKSRADQEAELHGAGETLLRHKNMLFETAARLNISKDQIDIYEEIVSGESLISRPEMQKLLSCVSEGYYAGVFVVELERLARGDSIDQGIIVKTFKFSNTNIITPGRTYDPNNESDENFFEFGLFMSRQEYKTINRRIQAGRLSSAKEGKFGGNIAPYGWQRKKLEKEKGWTLEPNENEYPVLKKIYFWLLEEEHTANWISRQLHTLGIKTRNGKDFSPTRVREIVSNPVNAGYIVWGRRRVTKKMVNGTIVTSRPRNIDTPLYPGKHMKYAVLSLDEFNSVKSKLQRHGSIPCHPSMPLINPLAGILICKHCGRHMIRRIYKSSCKTGKIYDVVMCPNEYCTCVSGSFPRVEQTIEHALSDWLKNTDIVFHESPAVSADISFYTENLNNICSKISKLKSQLERCYEFLESGLYSTDEFTIRCSKLKESIKAETEAKIETESILRKYQTLQHSKDIFIPKVKNVMEIYHSLTTAEAKRDLLATVIDHIDYEKTERNKKGETADKFTLTIYPLLPE